MAVVSDSNAMSTVSQLALFMPGSVRSRVTEAMALRVVDGC